VSTTTSHMTTLTLDVPGATLTYDVRRNEASTEPILLLIGLPMGAAGFGTWRSTSPIAQSSPMTHAGPSAAS
jgi:hypothetical protein